MSHASISQAKSSRIFIVCQLLPVTDHFGSLATIFIMNIFILACYKYPEHFPQKTSKEDDSEIIARFSLYGDTIRIHDTIYYDSQVKSRRGFMIEDDKNIFDDYLKEMQPQPTRWL